ncbi:hypothetical protein SERLA73DRAFT_107259 [Serpula lacrymans var. lacrymans S7.3]|uniref:Uncharacterized protein n=2 Tax=Serpula lacrymans var. lacrymans TaxID=341189 RepID=F8PW56_SERL3|nr:hypothetical protein SERLA73DRAFT_107259 [Serpula lacrymans var. lacrymans S7.3]
MEKETQQTELIEKEDVCVHSTPKTLGTVISLPPELWLEIFHHATFRPHSRDITPSDPFQPQPLPHNAMSLNTVAASMQTKSTIVQVCRLWRAIATELLYEHITVYSPWRARKILTAMALSRCSDPIPDASGEARKSFNLLFVPGSHGQWARRIDICAHTRFTTRSYIRYIMDIFHILRHCPQLRALSMSFRFGVPEEFQTAVSQLYGQSLIGLAWDGLTIQNPCSSHAFVQSFQALRVLDIRSISTLMLDDNHITHVLPCVRELLVSSEISSLEFAGALELPALRRVVFTRREKLREDSYIHALESFLRLHGSRIVDLEVDLPPCHYNLPIFRVSHFLRPEGCPNLEQLVFHSIEPAVVDIPTPHQALRRIGLRGVKIERLYDSADSNLYGVKAHMKSFNHTLFPRLEIVRTVGFLVASSVDELAIDVFIAWTEYFEKEGIDLQDGEGVVWLYAEPDPYSKGPRYMRE